jgi:hypothetical protein
VVDGDLLGDVLLVETPFELVETPFELVETVEVKGTTVFDWE